MISSRIERDSKAPNGSRLTTFVVTYPRFIHSEVMTHRAFSRNASSSRAVPFNRQLKAIREEMAYPLHFRENRPGMQAGAILSPFKRFLAHKLWRWAGLVVLQACRLLHLLNVHKQYVNRLLEPWSHISVIITGTQDAYTNFFALRDHSDAQPEIAYLAALMRQQYQLSSPQKLQTGEAHLPFVSPDEITQHLLQRGPLPYDASSWLERNNDPSIAFDYWFPLIKRSVARCARVSYLKHDGTSPSVQDDERLYHRLVGSSPKHCSPAEAVAVASALPTQSGNFSGFHQFRKSLENEFITSLE